MNTDLAREHPVSELTGDGECGRLDPRLFAILVVVDLSLEALPLRPSQVHAHQHFGPVLRLRSARAGCTVTIAFSGSVSWKASCGLPAHRRTLRARASPARVPLDRLRLRGRARSTLRCRWFYGKFVCIGEARLHALTLSHQRLRGAGLDHIWIGELRLDRG